MARFVTAALSAGKFNDHLDAGDIEGAEEVMTLAIGIGLVVIAVVIAWYRFETSEIRRLKPMVTQIIKSSPQPVLVYDILSQLAHMDSTDDSLWRLYVVLDLLDANGVTKSMYIPRPPSDKKQRWVSLKETV